MAFITSRRLLFCQRISKLPLYLRLSCYRTFLQSQQAPSLARYWFPRRRLVHHWLPFRPLISRSSPTPLNSYLFWLLFRRISYRRVRSLLTFRRLPWLPHLPIRRLLLPYRCLRFRLPFQRLPFRLRASFLFFLLTLHKIAMFLFSQHRQLFSF